jgi:hypothetical protein
MGVTAYAAPWRTAAVVGSYWGGVAEKKGMKERRLKMRWIKVEESMKIRDAMRLEMG